MSNPMTTAGDLIVGGTSGSPTRLGVGSNNQVLKVVSGNVEWAADSTGLSSITRNYGVAFTNPSQGDVGYFSVADACTITGWRVMAIGGTSPTLTADIWLISSGTALPTVSNTITASAKPALSSGNVATSTTLTGWTTSVSSQMIGAVKLDALSGSPSSVQVIFFCQQ